MPAPEEVAATERSLLLGMDHAGFGEYALALQGGNRTAAAISVGSDVSSMAHVFKGDPAVPNEDAVLAIDEGPRTLLAVADAHYGHASSHHILEELDAHVVRIPRNVFEIFDLLSALVAPAELEYSPSESTLLVSVFDRVEGRGVGVCFGDSSLVVVGANGEIVPCHSRNRAYVTPWDAPSLNPTRAIEFAMTAGAGDLLVAFTDGVDECCYGDARASIQPADIARIARETEYEPEEFVATLVELALVGVRGNPGGQDNVAIAATRV